EGSLDENPEGLSEGEEFVPFDRIIITCSVTRIPELLLKQLKDGGLIVVPIGETYDESYLTVVRKDKDQLHHQPVIPCRFVPMTGKIQESK
ncbi:MAG: protein-L-isoaspartate(D-aspartate) O-methyltransferase, partial [Planctomycetota bacterium]|nr:protein-L-isoaspartate(D-aspartate) O-methyltransferase [Planctomycetota bacterium]